MDFWELLKLLARRWWIVLPVLAVTGLMMSALPTRVEPTFESTASVILVGPSGGDAVTSQNPFLTATLAANAAAVAAAANSPEVSRRAADAGISTDYAVEPAESNSSVLTITTRAASPAESRDAANYYIKQLNAQVVDQQDLASVPPEAQMVFQLVTPDPATQRVFDEERRMRILILVLGFLTAVILALAFEGVRRQRSRRRLSAQVGAIAALPAHQRNALVDSQLAILAERDHLLQQQERLLLEYGYRSHDVQPPESAQGGSPDTDSESGSDASATPTASSPLFAGPSLPPEHDELSGSSLETEMDVVEEGASKS